MFNFSIIHSIIPTLSEIYYYQTFSVSSVKMAGILGRECNHQSHISTELRKTAHYQGPFSTRRNFPRGMIFSFVFWCPLSTNWSLNKRKCRSARKIPPSGKWPKRSKIAWYFQTEQLKIKRVLHKFFPFELQIVHINIKVTQEEKMHDIFNWALMKNIQCFKICFVRIFGFYAMRVDWRRKVMQANIKIPHKIKVHDIFNWTARSIRK